MGILNQIVGYFLGESAAENDARRGEEAAEAANERQRQNTREQNAWNAAPNQRRLLEAANLNVNQLVSGVGAGGASAHATTSTGASGGGGQNKGVSGGGSLEEATILSNIKLMESQREKNEADARKSNVDADKTEGVDTALTQEQIFKAAAETTGQELQNVITTANGKIAQVNATMAPELAEIELRDARTQLSTALVGLEMARRENRMSEETYETRKQIVDQSLKQSVAATALTMAQAALARSSRELTEAQAFQIFENIDHMWATYNATITFKQIDSKHFHQGQALTELMHLRNLEAGYNKVAADAASRAIGIAVGGMVAGQMVGASGLTTGTGAQVLTNKELLMNFTKGMK